MKHMMVSVWRDFSRFFKKRNNKSEEKPNSDLKVESIMNDIYATIKSLLVKYKTPYYNWQPHFEYMCFEEDITFVAKRNGYDEYVMTFLFNIDGLDIVDEDAIYKKYPNDDEEDIYDKIHNIHWSVANRLIADLKKDKRIVDVFFKGLPSAESIRIIFKVPNETSK